MTASEHERSIPSSRVDAAAGAARVARYAEAIVASDGDVLGRRAIDAVARAVMAVADEEQAELRAETQATIDRLGERVAYYRDSEVPALRSNADGWAARADAAEAEIERLREDADHTSCVESYTALLARLDALVADLRGLADEIGPFGDIDATPAVEGMFDLTHVQAHSVASQVQGVIRDHLRAVLDKHAGEQARGGEGRG